MKETTTISTRDECSPSVSVVGRRVSLAAGKIGFRGVFYDYAAETFDVDVSPITVSVHGYLIKETATGNISLLVDDVSETDPPYEFSGSPYVVMHPMFTILMRPNAESIDSDDVIVHRVTKKAPRTNEIQS